MPADHISIDDAKQDKLFYFVANVIVYRASDSRCLLLKRDERETTHGGKYGFPGGKLEWNNLDLNAPTRIDGDVLDFEDSIEDLIRRELLEEAGITIDSQLTYINSTTFVRPDGIPVVLVKFAATYKSGEVKLEKGAFTDYAWANEYEVDQYDCIHGIPAEVKKTIKHLKE